MLPADSLMIVMKKDKQERFISERETTKMDFNTLEAAEFVMKIKNYNLSLQSLPNFSLCYN